MATTSAALKPSSTLHADRLFFPFVSMLTLAVVLIGFARTYFLAGMVRAPLPNRLVHIHGAAFTLWILLVVVQTGLIRSRRVRLHRTLGIAGFTLAVVMVCLGLAVARDAMLRDFVHTSHFDAETFFLVPVTSMVLFSTLVCFAWRTRFDKVAHKRLITLATLSLLDAALVRWPFAFAQSELARNALYFGLVLLVTLYDLTIFHKVQRVTLLATGFIIALHFAEIPLGRTAAWHRFAEIVAGL